MHQDIVAEVVAAEEYCVEDLVAAAGRSRALLVVLDGIEDPHNVGAILRTADAAGVHGVVRQARHAASLDGVVAKASAGALAHVRIATVVNIARAVEELKDAGVWTIGLAGDRRRSGYDAPDLTLPTAIVLGAEGTGLRRLVRERCDRLVSIPMAGAVSSLNVSVAAGIMLFEAERQRRLRASYRGARSSSAREPTPSRRGTGPGPPCCSSAVVKNSRGLAPVARAVLQILFCLGWRSSVR